MCQTMLRSVVLLCAILCGASCFAQSVAKRDSVAPPSASAYTHLADELEANLFKEVLPKWFPTAVDKERGGFHQNYREDWSRDPKADRSLVYQARLTWLSAAVAPRYPKRAKEFRRYSLHGLNFLESKVWDSGHGGFWWALDENGSPQRHGEKHAYGIAFGIYAAAACYHATHDPRALSLAQRAYKWLEASAHDAKHGGYYEALSSLGKPILEPPDPSTRTDFIGTQYGQKSMNTHIHVLEALTELYSVWPDPQLRWRLEEVFALVRDRITLPAGCLNLYFQPDWSPVPGNDSYGHDIETAFLLAEAAHRLGKPNDKKTWSVARRLVDHALEFGWDKENGGFFDGGTISGPTVDPNKIWWTQAEGLNALVLMHEKYGKETSRYWQALSRQWSFIHAHQVDARYGGWYPTVLREGTAPKGHVKSDQWTEAYHQGRALLQVSEALRRLASEPRKQ